MIAAFFAFLIAATPAPSPAPNCVDILKASVDAPGGDRMTVFDADALAQAFATCGDTLSDPHEQIRAFKLAYVLAAGCASGMAQATDDQDALDEERPMLKLFWQQGETYIGRLILLAQRTGDVDLAAEFKANKKHVDAFGIHFKFVEAVSS